MIRWSLLFANYLRIYFICDLKASRGTQCWCGGFLRNKKPFTTFKLRSQYLFSNNDIIYLLFLLFRRKMQFYWTGLNSSLSYMTFSGRIFCTFTWCPSACFYFCRSSILKISSERLSNFLRKKKCLPCLMATMQCSGNHGYPRISWARH